MRLYELFKSYEFIGSYESIEGLRKLLMLEREYTCVSDFRRYVVDKAIAEIERFTDLTVSYTLKKKKREITGFIFNIRKLSGNAASF